MWGPRSCTFSMSALTKQSICGPRGRKPNSDIRSLQQRKDLLQGTEQGSGRQASDPLQLDLWVWVGFCVVVVVFFATPHGMWILVFQPGIESVSPALEAQNLNHWTIWKCPPVYTRSLWKFWWVSLSNKIHLGQFGNPDSFFPPDIKNWMIYSWWFFLLKHKNLYRELLFSKSSQDSTYTALKNC